MKNNLISSSKKSRLRIIALVCTFSIIIEGAGHGIGPFGFLLVFGDWGWDTWLVSNLFGLLGIFLIVVSQELSLSKARILLTSGLSALATSWYLFFTESELKTITILTSTPFFIVFIIMVADCYFLGRSLHQDERIGKSAEQSSPRQSWFVLNVEIIICFLFVVVEVSTGYIVKKSFMGGLMLFEDWGSPQHCEWSVPNWFALLGCGVLLFSQVKTQKIRIGLAMFGMILIIASWILLIQKSNNQKISVATSIPLIACCFMKIKQVLSELVPKISTTGL